MNLVVLKGRLGADPEMKQVGQKSTPMTRLRLATSEWNGATGKEETQWHTVVLWERLAENAAAYLTKGREVLIQGKLLHRSYEKNGQKQWTTEVRAFHMEFCGPKTEGSGGGGASNGGGFDFETASGDEDDVPF
jgi:single-strand DNA-binding protein